MIIQRLFKKSRLIPKVESFKMLQSQRVNYSNTNANEQISTTATTPPMTKSETKSKFQALLALLPGETAFAKTAYTTMGTGLGAFLISQGIYIPNDETLVLIAFALTTRVLYTKLSGPLSEYLEKSIQELRDTWMSSSIAEKEKITNSIDEMSGFRDHTDVTAAFYETRRENIILQAELDELLARNKFLSSIKQRLDEQVRKEKERAAAERKAHLDALIAGIDLALQDPKTQDAILKKCINDLETMENKIVV